MGNKAAKENNNHNVDPNNLPDDMDDDGEGEGNGPNGQKKLSYWQMMQQGYQELVNAIIRPPRCKYSPNHLGPAHFQFGSKTFQRTDFELRNLRGLKIVCSMWEPTQDCRQNPILPCVIYMHGNSSARLEAIPQLALVLSLGITMLSFDFCGSGLSEGDYVSLGAFEKDDLKVSAYIFFFFVTKRWLVMYYATGCDRTLAFIRNNIHDSAVGPQYGCCHLTASWRTRPVSGRHGTGQLVC
jgi:hypothetical protein